MTAPIFQYFGNIVYLQMGLKNFLKKFWLHGRYFVGLGKNVMFNFLTKYYFFVLSFFIRRKHILIYECLDICTGKQDKNTD